MIYDRFENIDLYFGKDDKLYCVLQFAADFDTSQPDGKYEIEGNDIYAMVMSYDTKPADELKFEAHKKYIDVQLLLAGREFLDVSLDNGLKIDTPYSEEKDVVLFDPAGNCTSVLLEDGNFVILYPHDVHQPGRQITGAESIRKMVIKVRV